MKSVLASVVDGVKSGTLVKIDDKFNEGLLVPNEESDFVFTSSTGTITGYTGTRLDVVIPSKIGGVAVLKIGASAFASKDLTSVYIPNGIKYIYEYAFRENDLTSISLPDSVIFVGDGCFKYNAITTVKLSKSMTTLNEELFYYNKIPYIEIPEGITKIDSFVFYKNYTLTDVDLPDSLLYIYPYSFYGNKLTSIKIPKNVKSISFSAFTSNPLLTAEIPTATSVTQKTELRDAAFPVTTVITRY